MIWHLLTPKVCQSGSFQLHQPHPADDSNAFDCCHTKSGQSGTVVECDRICQQSCREKHLIAFDHDLYLTGMKSDGKQSCCRLILLWIKIHRCEAP